VLHFVWLGPYVQTLPKAGIDYQHKHTSLLQILLITTAKSFIKLSAGLNDIEKSIGTIFQEKAQTLNL
jgi:hypothetical protein